jgi:hypothetical protein
MQTCPYCTLPRERSSHRMSRKWWLKNIWKILGQSCLSSWSSLSLHWVITQALQFFGRREPCGVGIVGSRRRVDLHVTYLTFWFVWLCTSSFNTTTHTRYDHFIALAVFSSDAFVVLCFCFYDEERLSIAPSIFSMYPFTYHNIHLINTYLLFSRMPE